MSTAERQPPWVCPQCRAENFGTRQQCLSCGAARPSAEATPPTVRSSPPSEATRGPGEPTAGEPPTILSRRAAEPPARQPRPANLPSPPTVLSRRPGPPPVTPPVIPPPSPPPTAGYPHYPPHTLPPAQTVPATSRRGWRTACLLFTGLALLVVCGVVGGVYMLRQPLRNLIAEQFLELGLGEVIPETSPSQVTPDQSLPVAGGQPATAVIPPQPTTEQSLPQATNTPTLPGVSFEGIQFNYQPELASAVYPSRAEASLEPGFPMPMFYEFVFDGYPDETGLFVPVISVFPAQEYRELDPNAAEQISQLQNLLEHGRGDPAEQLPFLPVMMAGQLIRARVDILRFQNGAGVRYLTQFAQDAWPINSEDLIYTYQGLTDDRLYYISALFPLSQADLPATGADYPAGDYLSFSHNFSGYAAGVTRDLNQTDPTTFYPDLRLLDAIIQSLVVAP